MESFLCEVLGLSLIGVSGFLVTKYFKLKSLFEKTNTPSLETAYFISIPLAVYAAFRIYFGVVFFVAEKTISKIIPNRFQSLASSCTTYLAIGGACFGIYSYTLLHDNNEIILNVLTDLRDDYIGSVPEILYQQSKPDIESAYNFGLKILSLLGGWFLFLFSFELVLSIIINIFTFIYRFFFRGNNTKTIEKVSTSSTDNRDAE